MASHPRRPSSSSSSSSSSSDADPSSSTNTRALRARFDAASDFFGQLVSADPSRVPDATKLRCYGLYKQATSGDAPLRTASSARGGNGGPPPWWRPWWGAAASKWRTWSAVRGTASARAMELYVEEVRRAAPEWDGGGGEGAARAASAQAGARGAGGGGPGGAVFSRPREQEEDDDGDETAREEGSATVLHELAGKGDVAAIVAHLDGVARRAAAEEGAAEGGREDVTAAAALLATSTNAPSHLRAAAEAVRAAVAARDRDGATPLHFAADRGRAEAAALLGGQTYGGSGGGALALAARAADSDGATPLHYAAVGGHAACCEVLLRECGADAAMRDADGKTARELVPEDDGEEDAGRWAFWPAS